MKQIVCTLMTVCFLVGCIPVFIGAGVVAGYTLTNDSAIGEVKTTYRDLWDIANDELKEIKAEIIYSNESKGIIKASASKHAVTIRINTLSPERQKLIISARKYFLPKPQFAQKIFFAIAKNLQ